MLAVLLVSAMTQWATAAQIEPKRSNSLGMTFVLIPAGSFVMGSPPAEAHRDPSETPHKVILTQPFYMQTGEVTYRQWQAVMGTGFFMRWNGPENHPITKVSWYDVQDFVKKLNQMGQGVYRLPTEAEWEYAARAGSTTAFSWGDEIDCAKAMYANSRYGVGDCLQAHEAQGLPLNSPANVKSYAPNVWELHDMHGNVWEWVQDWFGPYPAVAVFDPRGPDEGTVRVRRGGSWYGAGYYCRSANRAYAHPASRQITTGFRLVQVAAP